MIAYMIRWWRWCRLELELTAHTYTRAELEAAYRRGYHDGAFDTAQEQTR